MTCSKANSSSAVWLVHMLSNKASMLDEDRKTFPYGRMGSGEQK